MGRGKSASPLAKVRGLGSSGEGGEHWLTERFTSVVLVLLSAWLLGALLTLPDLGYATLRAWLATPLAAVPMARRIAPRSMARISRSLMQWAPASQCSSATVRHFP